MTREAAMGGRARCGCSRSMCWSCSFATGFPSQCPGPTAGCVAPVPLGRRIALPGRGTTFVREVAGPPGAPTLLLVHGWLASGGLNWFRTFEALGRDFHVLAPDLRGHARGLRSGQGVPACRLRRRSCQPARRTGDGAGARRRLLDGRACRPAALPPPPRAGRRSGALRDGTPVLARLRGCATGRCRARCSGDRRALRRTRHSPTTGAAARPSYADASSRPRDFMQWMIAEFRRHDVRHLLEAARDASGFDGRSWLREVDAPAAVVVTTRDRVVAPRHQLEAAALIDGASVHEIDGGHFVCATKGFVEPLCDACRDVAGPSSAEFASVQPSGVGGRRRPARRARVPSRRRAPRRRRRCQGRSRYRCRSSRRSSSR